VVVDNTGCEMLNRLLQIHPTAVLSPQAALADNVTIGPHAVVGGKSSSVRIAPFGTG
jgi:acyl-[acyl carrier protein]--UDP-N-acetylglucosamine O-acyltransferase